METIELIEGVEILTKSAPIPLGISIFLGVLCLVVLAFSIYLLVLNIIDSFGGGVILSLVFVIMSVTLLGIVVGETCWPTVTYKVTVDDSVSINEFYERYEVIDVDGKIYSIQEREESKS